MKKKREYSAELRRIEYDLNEKIGVLEHEL